MLACREIKGVQTRMHLCWVCWQAIPPAKHTSCSSCSTSLAANLACRGLVRGHLPNPRQQLEAHRQPVAVAVRLPAPGDGQMPKGTPSHQGHSRQQQTPRCQTWLQTPDRLRYTAQHAPFRLSLYSHWIGLVKL